KSGAKSRSLDETDGCARRSVRTVGSSLQPAACSFRVVFGIMTALRRSVTARSHALGAGTLHARARGVLRLGFVALVVASCVTSHESTAPAPLVGSNDAADHNCSVVMRDLGREWTGISFATDNGSWIWQG